MGSQKGLATRIERKLEATVGDAFARLFGGSIVPQEVEALLRREAEDGVQPLQGNRLLAPNEYIITLGVHDFEKVGTDPDLMSGALARYLTDYIDEQGWQTYGEVVVRFERAYCADGKTLKLTAVHTNTEGLGGDGAELDLIVLARMILQFEEERREAGCDTEVSGG